APPTSIIPEFHLFPNKKIKAFLDEKFSTLPTLSNSFLCTAVGRVSGRSSWASKRKSPGSSPGLPWSRKEDLHDPSVGKATARFQIGRSGGREMVSYGEEVGVGGVERPSCSGRRVLGDFH